MTRNTTRTSRNTKRVGAIGVLAAIACAPTAAGAAPSTTEPASPVEVTEPPVEFSACNEGYDEAGVTAGDEETVTIPGPDGDITLNRGRGWIVPQIMSDVSDPRLDGDWTLFWNEDDYIDPRRDHTANIVTEVWRIENDEGAWQGTHTVARIADDIGEPTVVLAGEGAYEGLTAVMVLLNQEQCPNMMGWIITGDVPEAEGPSPTG